MIGKCDGLGLWRLSSQANRADRDDVLLFCFSQSTASSMQAMVRMVLHERSRLVLSCSESTSFRQGGIQIRILGFSLFDCGGGCGCLWFYGMVPPPISPCWSHGWDHAGVGIGRLQSRESFPCPYPWVRQDSPITKIKNHLIIDICNPYKRYEKIFILFVYFFISLPYSHKNSFII